MKRGQATLFIILGIILVALIVLIAFYKDQFSESLQKTGLIKKEALDTEAEKITQEINNCLEDLTGEAILYVASNNEGLPELKSIENSVSDYINQMIPFCILNNKFNTQVEAVGKAKTSTEITNNIIKIRVNYPVAVILEDSSTTITNFNAGKDTRIGLIHELAKEIEALHKEQPGICLSCLFEIGSKNNLKIDVYNPENTQEAHFVMTDEENLINNRPLIFTFIIKLEETI
ncbi:MAG: hypothetical protein V1914_02140 [archaeon]